MDDVNCMMAMEEEEERAVLHPAQSWCQEHFGFTIASLSSSSTREFRHRGCFADRTFEAGDVVLGCRPAAFVIRPRYWSERCAWCFRTVAPTTYAEGTESSHASSLKRCGGCQSVHYCSKECQQWDWKAGHRCECKKLFPQLRHNMDALCDASLLHRAYCKKCSTFWFAQNSRGPELPYTTTENVAVYQHTFKDVSQMESDLETTSKINKDLAMSQQQLANFVSSLINAAGSELAQTLNAFSRNNFAIWDLQMNSYGAGCYPVASLFNHSCRPNCIAVFNTPGDHTLYLRTLKPIDPGEELVLSYIDVAQTKKERHKELLTQYGFKCCCGRCAEELQSSEPDYTIDSQRPTSYAQEERTSIERAWKLLEEANGLVDTDSPEPALMAKRVKLEENALTLLERYLHHCHPRVISTRKLLWNDYTVIGELAKARAQCEALATAYQELYNAGHPLVGRELQKCSELARNMSQEEDEQKCRDAAKKVFRVCLGLNHFALTEDYHEIPLGVG
eukprot:gb/GECG01000837.1/.p1 GENE.gb/GECG01000837.1/~~gb/GECG01000837.1/.p1  ORF type:complete len:506 (+),score=49.26 gb/GECG01000837.1/:1-1518(+)